MKLRIFAVTAVLAGPAIAQDDALYAPAPDPNLSYVRVIDPGSAGVTVGSEVVSGDDGGVSPYVGIDAAEIAVRSDNIETVLDVEPATYYTLVGGDDGEVRVITDTITNSPAKADLAFYNNTDLTDVAIFVPQAEAEAMSGVGAQSSQSVSLNAPLMLDFELRAGGETVATVSQVDLRRGEGVSVVLTGTEGAYEASVTNNSFAY